jgi:tRNA nucleotidyltransferase (CCA-adding enzyme)
MCQLRAKVINAVLQEGNLYEVGGAVRDRLLFDAPIVKDRDYLVTGIPYDRLERLLRPHGRVDMVGRSFGVIKFTQFDGDNATTFDFTLPRKEFSTGAGHKDFSVTFDPNLSVEDDLVRRDFTINAIAYDIRNDQLIDPLRGRDDLDKRQIRMVYDDSFKDDPLRMLRAIQFAARFDFTIESGTYDAIVEHVSRVKSVSPERIAEELNKLLVLAKAPSVGFRMMQKTGMLRELLPEFDECVDVDQPGPYHMYDVFEHTLHAIDACPQRLRVRLAALFHDINKPQARRLTDTGATFYGHEVVGARTAKSVMKRLRYSNDMIDDVTSLVERHMFTTDVTDKGLRRLVKRVGVDLIFDLLDLRRADIQAQGRGGTWEDVDQFEQNIRDELAKKPPFSISDLAIDGHDIMKMFDLTPGPKVGAILNHLLENVLDNPEDNSREKLESIAREFYQSNMASLKYDNNEETSQ